MKILIFLYIQMFLADDISFTSVFNFINKFTITENTDIHKEVLYIKNNSPIDFLENIMLIHQKIDIAIYHIFSIVENPLFSFEDLAKICESHILDKEDLNYFIKFIYSNYDDVFYLLYDILVKDCNYFKNLENINDFINTFNDNFKLEKSEKLFDSYTLDDIAKIFSSIFLINSIPELKDELLPNVPTHFRSFIIYNDLYNNHFNSLISSFQNIVFEIYYYFDFNYLFIIQLFREIFFKLSINLMCTYGNNIENLIKNFNSYEININKIECSIKKTLDCNDFSEYMKHFVEETFNKFKSYFVKKFIEDNNKIYKLYMKAIEMINQMVKDFLNENNLDEKNILMFSDKLNDMVSSINFCIFKKHEYMCFGDKILLDSVKKWLRIKNNIILKYNIEEKKKIFENESEKKNYKNERVYNTCKSKLEKHYAKMKETYENDFLLKIEKVTSDIFTKFDFNEFKCNEKKIEENNEDFLHLINNITLQYLEKIIEYLSDTERRELIKIKDKFEIYFLKIKEYMINLIELYKTKLKNYIYVKTKKNLSKINTIDNTTIDIFQLMKTEKKFIKTFNNKEFINHTNESLLREFDELKSNIKRFSDDICLKDYFKKNYFNDFYYEKTENILIESNEFNILKDYGSKLINSFEYSFQDEDNNIEFDCITIKQNQRNMFISKEIFLFKQRNEIYEDFYLKCYVSIADSLSKHVYLIDEVLTAFNNALNLDDLVKLNSFLERLKIQFFETYDFEKKNFFNFENINLDDNSKDSNIRQKIKCFIEYFFSMEIYILYDVIQKIEKLLIFNYDDCIKDEFINWNYENFICDNLFPYFSDFHYLNILDEVYADVKSNILLSIKTKVNNFNFTIPLFKIFSPNYLLTLYIYKHYFKDSKLLEFIAKNIYFEIQKICKKKKYESNKEDYLKVFFDTKKYSLDDYHVVINKIFEYIYLKNNNYSFKQNQEHESKQKFITNFSKSYHYNIIYKNLQSINIKNNIIINYKNANLQIFKNYFNLNHIKKKTAITKNINSYLYNRFYQIFEYSNFYLFHTLEVLNEFYFILNEIKSREELLLAINILKFDENLFNLFLFHLFYFEYTNDEYINLENFEKFEKLISTKEKMNSVVLNLQYVINITYDSLKDYISLLKLRTRYKFRNIDEDQFWNNCKLLIINHFTYFYNFENERYIIFLNLCANYIFGFFYAHLQDIYDDEKKTKDKDYFDQLLHSCILNISELELMVERSILLEFEVLFLLKIKDNTCSNGLIEVNNKYSNTYKKILDSLIFNLCKSEKGDESLKTNYMIFILKNKTIKMKLFQKLLKTIKNNKSVNLKKKKLKFAEIFKNFKKTFLYKEIYINKKSDYFEILNILKNIFSI